MKIAVFGATGNVGSTILNEAMRRDHAVTAIIRKDSDVSRIPADIDSEIGDVSNDQDIKRIAADYDVVIAAIRPPEGEESKLIDMSKALLKGFAGGKARLVVVGGAGGLIVPDTGGKVADDTRYVGAAWYDIAKACSDQLALYQSNSDVNWTYLAPPAMLRPGERTAQYRIGQDQLLLDADGQSRISIEDFAVAMLDEVEAPLHTKKMFTVAY